MNWYRQHLKDAIPPLLEKWQKRLGVEVSAFGIKRMKTKWGTCNVDARRIWINLELAKKSSDCLEYVVMHELVHLLAKHHDDRVHLDHGQAFASVEVFAGRVELLALGARGMERVNSAAEPMTSHLAKDGPPYDQFLALNSPNNQPARAIDTPLAGVWRH